MGHFVIAEAVAAWRPTALPMHWNRLQVCLPKNFFLFFASHDHPLSGWYVLPLLGDIACLRPEGALKSANCTTFTAAPNRGFFSASLYRHSSKKSLLVCFVFLLTLQAFYLLCFFTGSPVNGSIYSTNDIWSYYKSSFSWFWIYSLIFAVFFPTVST